MTMKGKKGGVKQRITGYSEARTNHGNRKGKSHAENRKKEEWKESRHLTKKKRVLSAAEEECQATTRYRKTGRQKKQRSRIKNKTEGEATTKDIGNN